MPIYSGRRGVLGLALESPRGTQTAPTFFIPYNELSFDNKTVKKELGGAYGSIQAVRANKTVKQYAEGSFGADLDDEAIGIILACVFGAIPTPAGTTNYTHTYVISESNQHQSLTATVQDPNVSGQFALGMVDQFEISVEPEGVVGYTVGLRSKAGVDETAVATDYVNLGQVFIHADCTIKIAADVASLAAAPALDVVGLTLSVNKNIADFNDIGSLTDRDIVNKDMKVEGSLVLGYSDQTFRDYDLDDSTKAISITFSKGANNNLVFTIPSASFEGWTPNKGLEDMVTQNITFKAVKGASSFFGAVLKNQIADYTADES